MRERRGLRKGQTFFNVLHELDPELAERLAGTTTDPFYDDGKLPEFVLRSFMSTDTVYVVPTPRRNAIVHHVDVEGDMGQRLDEEKLDQLRTWGAGLAASSNQELRATGKAILLLIEEIEALHVERWNERARATSEPMPADEPRDGSEEELGESLRVRLTRFTHRQPRAPG